MGARVPLFVVAAAVCAAGPVSAHAPYGGLGATEARFSAQNAHASAHYRIDFERRGRVAAYHVVLDAKAKPSLAALERLVTRGELPADAQQIRAWVPAPDPGSYCAIYRSGWLSHVLYGPYAVLYASPKSADAAATVSTAPACRG
ncbi:MAG TPA: hypothetical protein VI408_15285 [Gaiellaceae bacterium]